MLLVLYAWVAIILLFAGNLLTERQIHCASAVCELEFIMLDAKTRQSLYLTAASTMFTTAKLIVMGAICMKMMLSCIMPCTENRTSRSAKDPNDSGSTLRISCQNTLNLMQPKVPSWVMHDYTIQLYLLFKRESLQSLSATSSTLECPCRKLSDDDELYLRLWKDRDSWEKALGLGDCRKQALLEEWPDFSVVKGKPVLGNRKIWNDATSYNGWGKQYGINKWKCLSVGWYSLLRQFHCLPELHRRADSPRLWGPSWSWLHQPTWGLPQEWRSKHGTVCWLQPHLGRSRARGGGLPHKAERARHPADNLIHRVAIVDDSAWLLCKVL